MNGRPADEVRERETRKKKQQLQQFNKPKLQLFQQLFYVPTKLKYFSQRYHWPYSVHGPSLSVSDVRSIDDLVWILEII